MWENNDKINESGILQNQFTAYLGTAIRRKKSLYLQNKTRRQQYEMSLDLQDCLKGQAADDDLTNSLPVIDRLEDARLQRILKKANRRDLYILLAKVFENRSIAGIAFELGITYNAVAVAYHRIVRRIKEEMEGNAE
jgi:DNA-directed RNA polymerase specialized sigma24 family protein